MIEGHVLALCGGVGGAKFADGLASILAPEQLTIIVNTGDDFEHVGLSISPDIDTVLYTLAGLSDHERGWGVAEESWRAMEMLGRLGEAQWFKLGDRDLAMHIARTHRLRTGESLSQITADLAQRLGVRAAIAPMSNDPVRTEVETEAGVLPFQRYFVAEQCRPIARAIRFVGAEKARMSPVFEAALARRDLAAVLICPSNPYLSIDPILAVPGVRDRLAAIRAPRLAVSPIVAGKALKGPAAKLMAELGVEPDVVAVARHYEGLIDALIIDEADRELAGRVEAVGVKAVVAPAIMRTPADRAALAATALAAARKSRE